MGDLPEKVNCQLIIIIIMLSCLELDLVLLSTLLGNAGKIYVGGGVLALNSMRCLRFFRILNTP